MELTVYSPCKGRLLTIDIEFTDQNTTYFVAVKDYDISSITDYDGGLVIREHGYFSPVLIYGISRKDIGYKKRRAKQLLKFYLD